MASIDHALWFHRALRVMTGCCTPWRAERFRRPGLRPASVFARDGRLVASAAQEGLVRARRIPEPPQAATVMAALLGVLFAAAAADGADVEALQRLVVRVRDSSEQVVMSAERGASAWPLLSEQRVRTIVAPVSVAWLGVHVLYLEEFLEDDPRIRAASCCSRSSRPARPRMRCGCDCSPSHARATGCISTTAALTARLALARPGCLPGL